MRILKRNLAFVLVMAMAIGMMVTVNAANVEDYRDANDIKFTEAVDVMTALGILEGENGTFHPERVLTREEGAKIITYLMLGADGADNLNTSVAPFTDVAAGRWSAGFIAYCASQGIVGGYGNGNFGPTDTLTGTQFAKMLLVALGYGVNGEFTGANWEIETNKTALTAGVYEGNLGVNFSNGVKREEAAQYAFNTLANIMTVNYSDVFGAYYSGKIFNSEEKFNDEYTLGYQLYNLKKNNNGNDDFGRECHIWKANAKVLTGEYHDAPDAVYTSSVKASKIYTDLGLTNKTVNAELYVDGVLQVTGDKDEDGNDILTTWALTKNGDAKTKDIAGANIGNGVVVEAYANTDKTNEEVTLCVIHVNLAQVTKYNSKDEEVTVKGIDGANVGDGKFETAVEYEEDDYVLVTVANGKIKTLKPVTVVEGALNSTAKDSLKFESEKYDYAKKNTFNEGVYDIEGDEINFDNEYNLIVDEYGYALGLVLVEENEEVTNYVYVEKIQMRPDSLIDDNVAVVQVKNLDGTVEKLSLEVKDQKFSGTTTADYENGKKYTCAHWVGASVAGWPENWIPVEETNGAEAVGEFLGYTMSGDQIVLRELGDKAAGTTVTDFEFTGAKSYSDVGTNNVDMTVNSRTVVKVINDDNKITTYTGYNKIDFNLKGKSDMLVLFTDKTNGLAKEIYVIGSAKTESDNIFAYYTGNYSNSKDGYQVELVIDGDKDYHIYDISESAVKALEKGVFVVTLDNDNEVASMTALNDGDSEEDEYSFAKDKAVTEAKGDVFTAGDTKYYYAEENKTWDVTGSTIVEGSITEDNVISIVMDKDGYVKTIFITKADVNK